MNYDDITTSRDQRFNSDSPVRIYPRRFAEPPVAPVAPEPKPQWTLPVTTPAQRERACQTRKRQYRSDRASPTYSAPGICRNPACGATFERTGNSHRTCPKRECKLWAKNSGNQRRRERAVFRLSKAEKKAIREACPHLAHYRYGPGKQMCKACGKVTARVEFQEAA